MTRLRRVSGRIVSVYPIRLSRIRSGRARSARVAGAVLAGVLLSVGFLQITVAADAAAKVPNITGAWGSYPGPRSGPPDPKLAPPPPSPLLLKGQYKTAYEAQRAKEIESDKRGEPLGNASTECLPPGMPQMMSAIYPIEFIQSEGRVTVVAEAGTVASVDADTGTLTVNLNAGGTKTYAVEDDDLIGRDGALSGLEEGDNVTVMTVNDDVRAVLAGGGMGFLPGLGCGRHGGGDFGRGGPPGPGGFENGTDSLYSMPDAAPGAAPDTGL